MRLTLRKTKGKYISTTIIFKKYQVMSDEETLRKLKNSNCSIARFGDGELNIIIRGKGIGFQKSNEELVKRLKEVLESNIENLLIGIPKVMSRNYENYNEFAYNFWKKYYRKNIISLSKTIPRNKIYYSGQVTRFYMDAKDKSNAKKYVQGFREIWNNKEIIIVEGEKSRLGVGNDLFNNAKSIKRILCPAENCFEKYSEILQSCLQMEKSCIFILALGPTATVLAYDLAKQGCKALDLGHIDIEYEWYLRKATTKIKIENKYVNEAGGYEGNDNFEDKDYLKSIIKVIN